jgi:hypothetical protein
VDATDLRPPSRLALLREVLLVLELPKAVAGLPRLLLAPRGNGEPVLVVPGFATGDPATAVLRSALAGRGWDVHGWGLGVNTGSVGKLVPRIAARVEELAERTGTRVRLVGWSLGGYLAREVARERPAAVDRVITLGAPVVGGPKYTQSAQAYRRRGHDLDAIERTVAARAERPIEVPVTAIYSRLDGVVAWRACVDRTERRVAHVEVFASHLALVLSASVAALVAERLR